MSRLFAIPKPLRALLGQPSSKTVAIVVERFLQVFREHGIEATQIPRLLPEIKLEDLQSPETLLPVLNHDLLDKVAKLFGVRVQWLEGCDERIYDYLYTYKEPQLLLDHLRSLWHQPAWANEVGNPLRILTTTKHLDYREIYRHELAPILVEPIATLGDETIYRYHVYQDGFSWNHQPARIELKAIALTAYRALHKPIPIYPISEQDMEAVLEGRRIPRSLLGQCLNTDPSLEDYVFDTSESAASKEADELPVVLDYMARVGLNAYRFRIQPVDTPPPVLKIELEPVQELERERDIEVQLFEALPHTESPPAISPAKPGKRETKREIWRTVETSAIALWANDPSIPIQDMVRRLRMLPHLKIADTDDTIRGHIRHLAPEGIRGKPGRKPKQSG